MVHQPAAARKNQQRPESGGFPCVQECPDGHGPRRPARRIVDDDVCAGRADDDHVVKPSVPHFEQHDHGPPVAQEIRHALDRSGEADDAPTAIFDGLRQDAGGKAARGAIEQGRELIPVGLPVAPVPEHHRRRRASAECFRLPDVGHRQAHGLRGGSVPSARDQHRRDNEKTRHRSSAFISIARPRSFEPDQRRLERTSPP